MFLHIVLATWDALIISRKQLFCALRYQPSCHSCLSATIVKSVTPGTASSLGTDDHSSAMNSPDKITIILCFKLQNLCHVNLFYDPLILFPFRVSCSSGRQIVNAVNSFTGLWCVLFLCVFLQVGMVLSCTMIRNFIKNEYFFNPMPHMYFTDFVVFPPEYGRSVTDFWGWDAHEARLRCPDVVSGDIGGCSIKRALKPKFY